MIKNRKTRRPIAIALMAVGALLMFLATEVLSGVIMFIMGVVLELLGIKLEQEDDK